MVVCLYSSQEIITHKILLTTVQSISKYVFESDISDTLPFICINYFRNISQQNTSSTKSNKKICWKYTVPESPHQVGQPLVNFTTPEANMSLNRSHLTSQRDILSWWWCLDEKNCRFNGATRIVRKPVSNRRMSLKMQCQGLAYHW